MPPEPIDARLPDGARVRLRPISPEDKDRLRAGFQRLSSRSRYLRFHMPMEDLSDAHLRYLTEIDYADHMAWGAVDPDRPGEPGLGVARYVRLRDEPEVAEAAITVVDEFQGRGLGSLLFKTLADSAVEQGIETFRNYVLSENQAMLALFEGLGVRRAEVEPGVVQIDMPLLGGRGRERRGTIAERVFRHAASHKLPPLPFGFPPVWHRAEDEGAD